MRLDLTDRASIAAHPGRASADAARSASCRAVVTTDADGAASATVRPRTDVACGCHTFAYQEFELTEPLGLPGMAI